MKVIVVLLLVIGSFKTTGSVKIPVAQYINKLGLKLFSTLLQDNQDQTLLFSPTSAYMCLIMLYAGSSEDTRNSIAAALEIPPHIKISAFRSLIRQVTQDSKVKIYNKLFVDKRFDISQDYKTSIEDSLFGEIEQVSFRDVNFSRVVDAWARKKIQGRLRSTLNPKLLPTKISNLFAVNMLHFKDDWELQMVKMNKTLNFKVSENNVKICDVMGLSTRAHVRHDGSLNALILLLFYSDKTFSIVFLLPSYGTPVQEVEKQLAGYETLQDFLTEFTNEFVHIKIPNFRISNNLDLKRAFSKNGLNSVFSPIANFSLLTQNKYPLFVDDIIQSVGVTVDDLGTEASAATRINFFYRTKMMGKIINFDRPFLFVIQHHATATPLFMGRVFDPGCSPSEPNEQNEDEFKEFMYRNRFVKTS